MSDFNRYTRTTSATATIADLPPSRNIPTAQRTADRKKEIVKRAFFRDMKHKAETTNNPRYILIF